MNGEIAAALKRGDLILFLGAGASLGSLTAGGKDILDSSSLSRNLAEVFSVDYQGESLRETYNALLNIVGKNRLHEELESLFKNTSPSHELNTIATYPWPRIYTLNIDDTMDVALQRNSPQEVNIVGYYDRIRPLDTIYQKVELVKLAGDVKQLDRGVVFSPQDYGFLASNLPRWYDELATDFFSYKFLFIGTKLDEPLFHHAIEKYTKLFGDSGHISYLLTPSITEIQKNNLARAKIQHVPGRLSDFSTWLRTEFPKGLHTDEIMLTRRPELRTLLLETEESTKAILLDSLEFVDVVSRQTLRNDSAPPINSGSIRNFYRGFKPTWTDVLDGVPAQLASADKLLNRINEAIQDGPPIVVCYGPAGSGKSTLLRQVSLTLSEQTTDSVYFLREIPRDVLFLVQTLEKLNPKKYFLFTDNLDQIINDLEYALEHRVLKNGIIVASERQNIWRSRNQKKLSKHAHLTFQLGKIDNEDAPLLLEKIEKFGPWTRLERMSPDERIAEILTNSKRQLLIGLATSTLGMGFNEIIKRDFERIVEDEEKYFMLIVGIATLHRSPMPTRIAIRALIRMGYADDPNKLLSNLSGIMTESPRGYELRHPVYARSMFETSVDPEDILEVVKSILYAFTAIDSPVVKFADKNTAHIFKSILNHRFLNEFLGRSETAILEIYKSFEKPFQNDGLYWQQYGLSLRDFQRHEEALEKFETAVAAYETDHTLHALAQQYLILAEHVDSEIEARTYMENAIERLRNLRQIIPDEDTYPIVTLAEGHTKVIKKWKGDSAAREKAKEYANQLQEILKSAPNDRRLEAAWKRLIKYATTGMWPPRMNIKI